MPKMSIGNIVQLIGVVSVSIGITLECILGADIWYILITAGSLVFALGTKFKYGGTRKGG